MILYTAILTPSYRNQHTDLLALNVSIWMQNNCEYLDTQTVSGSFGHHSLAGSL